MCCFVTSPPPPPFSPSLPQSPHANSVCLQTHAVECSKNFIPSRLNPVVSRPDKISAADIAAICQEAGMQAVRKNRYVVLAKDFEKGYKTNVTRSETEFEFYK